MRERYRQYDASVNGLTLLLLLALAAGIVVAWRAGVMQGRREGSTGAPLRPLADEEARLARSVPPEAPALPSRQDSDQAMLYQLTQFAEERRHLLREVAAAREETARYRELCVDLENNAPPPILDGPHAPDDLKLIVGIGPVLERMLQKMGVSTYRQIARWSERDIDDFDARLPEFPGRIRRDAWVTQARALHQSKFGEALPPRER
jgi:NADH-quinone oxidoreductase subunit E